ncbi:hypothetical protein QTL97_09720 [Sporosarcina thermotolerans]|uniref:Uncharacterized protein n=1 Tax=Sporosarcina thermotolerans TaxID=633404 RepID=A0AAW9A889_9BACL|nr:hypothetical protein [Sporosarcina thermotolerans]MDW0117215.1 hypothetical protein [Sporosarcina thermotolerans]WHT47386.1 hypothetical protein QNH10_14435 [Sporosarcina thermotolerans]
MEINVMEILFFIAILWIMVIVWKINRRVTGIKHILDQLSKQYGVPENPINDELRKLISQGEAIKAEKIARKTLGLSMLEGMQYVDDLKKKGKNS